MKSGSYKGIVTGNEAAVLVSRAALIAMIREAAKDGDLSKFVPARDLANRIADQVSPYIKASSNTTIILSTNFREVRSHASGVLGWFWANYDWLEIGEMAVHSVDYEQCGVRANLVPKGQVTAFRHGYMDSLRGRDTKNAAYFNSIMQKLNSL